MQEKAWNTTFLDQMRTTGDDLADQTVLALFEQGEIEQVNLLLAHLIRHDGLPSSSLPPQVATYLAASSLLPPWADPQRIRNGQDIFRDFGLIAFSILGCASLPACYAAGDAAKVLWLTQQLETHVTRRIVETGQFIVDVMSPGGLEPGGRGILSAQKVRLMHAAVRHLVSTDPQAAQPNIPPRHFGDVLSAHRWKTDQWGLPINQQVMAGTLLTFSYIILKSLRVLGVSLPPQQEADYLHTWNVVGHIMGLHPSFLETADTYENAERLFNTILERNRDQGPEAQALTQAVIDFMAGVIRKALPLGSLLPVAHIPRMLIRDLVGDQTAAFLGIRLTWVDRAGSGLIARIMHGLGHFEAQAYQDLGDKHKMAEWLFREMAKEIWTLPRGGERDLFYIPAELADGWNLSRV